MSCTAIDGGWTSWVNGSMCLSSKCSSSQWRACQRFRPGRLPDSSAFLPGNMDAPELELLLHPVCKGCLLALYSALYFTTQPGNLSTESGCCTAVTKGLKWSGGRKPQWTEKLIQKSTDTTVSAAPPPSQVSCNWLYKPAAAFDNLSVMFNYINCFNRCI